MSVVALGINGRTWRELGDITELKGSLARMNSENLFSLVMWRLPGGKRFEGSNPSKNSSEYLQCAGSCDRMTVEIRRLENSKLIQYTVGLSKGTLVSEFTERIVWGEHHLFVAPREVFDAASAFPLFEEYFRSGELPIEVTLRESKPDGA